MYQTRQIIDTLKWISGRGDRRRSNKFGCCDLAYRFDWNNVVFDGVLKTIENVRKHLKSEHIIWTSRSELYVTFLRFIRAVNNIW